MDDDSDVDRDVIVSSAEILKDRLYFATLKGNYRPESTKNSKYFSVKDEIVYESFYHDYGPHHLCHLYFFCLKLEKNLAKGPETRKVVFYTSDDRKQRLNAAYLVGGYAIVHLGRDPKAAYELVTEGEWDLLAYRDASGGYPLFEIALLDVFEGLHKAFKGGFFDFGDFNYHEYMHYEKVINGDLNWIIPGKMLAFSGPHSATRMINDYPVHAPDHYHRYFRENDVTTVVRLNQKTYNAKQFTEYGFEHYDLFFVDGSVPSDAIVESFNRICERAEGAVAVHCKAGLGRTGTLIACYMMKHHEFTARQAVGWLRICRPGSVIGFQQNFLIGIQSRMLAEGAQYRRKRGATRVPRFKYGVYSKARASDCENVENFTDLNVGNSSLEDVENVQSARCKDGETSFVSLGSIVEPTVATRSMTQRARAHAALADAKRTYAANRGECAAAEAPKAPGAKKGTPPAKGKGGPHFPRANLARSHGPQRSPPPRSFPRKPNGAPEPRKPADDASDSEPPAMSADSLESIPRKANKSEETQGARLCRIKAARKKPALPRDKK